MARVHRWLGIALCVVVALWFLTGSVLSFVPFPLLDRSQRLVGSAVIEPAMIRIAPSVALARAAAPDGRLVQRARLVAVDGEARYVVVRADGGVVAVSAMTGQASMPLDRAGAERIASAFAGAPVLRSEGPFTIDQWTVHGGYVAARPYHRVRMADEAATDIYVSARTGEVAQRTRRAERAWNYVGAVVHWINPVVLRQDYVLWRRVVWTLALGGIVLAMLGLWLGARRWLQARQLRRAGFSPFRGLLRWHHALGLGAGLLLLGWVGSGWLSLDNGQMFSTGEAPAKPRAAYHGMTLERVAEAFPVDVLQQVHAARELEFTAVGGTPLLIARGATPGDTRVWRVDAGGALRSAAAVPVEQLAVAVARAWAPTPLIREVRVAADDAYSLRIAPLPANTWRFMLDDAAANWVQIDATDGSIVSVLDRSGRVRRWLVEGLHTFDFPWLNRAGSLWHVLLLIGTASGFVLSCTGAVLGFRRLRRATGRL